MFVFQTAQKDGVSKTSSAETQRSIFSDNISFSFFKTMMQSDKNNVGFSPYSAASALALLYAGADDKTKNSIKNKLGLTSNDEGILKMLNKSEVAGFSSVNLIASQSGFKPSYETSIKVHGGAVLTGNEANAGKINGWVSENTDNKINNLISGSVNAALVNAVLFDAKWVTPFGGTKSGEFTNADNSVSTVGYMSGQQGGKANQSCQYYDGRDLQAVKLDYKNGASLYVLLPKDGDDGNMTPLDGKFMESLKGDWKTIQTSLSTSPIKDVNLEFPKLASFEYKTNIKKSLENLLPGVLSSNNFKGILSGGTGFPIDQIIQATKLSIDEKGTSMAAATAVLSRGGGGPPKMKVDHPFLLVLTLPNGDIAYMGAVKDLSGLAKAQEENKDTVGASKTEASSVEDMNLKLSNFFSNSGYSALSELVDVRNNAKGASSVSVLTDKVQTIGMIDTYRRQGFQDTKTNQNISDLKVSMEKNAVGEDIFKLRLEYPSGGDPPDVLEINPKTREVKYSVENADGTLSFQKNHKLNKSVEKAGE